MRFEIQYTDNQHLILRESTHDKYKEARAKGLTVEDIARNDKEMRKREYEQSEELRIDMVKKMQNCEDIISSAVRKKRKVCNSGVMLKRASKAMKSFDKKIEEELKVDKSLEAALSSKQLVRQVIRTMERVGKHPTPKKTMKVVEEIRREQPPLLKR